MKHPKTGYRAPVRIHPAIEVMLWFLVAVGIYAVIRLFH